MKENLLSEVISMEKEILVIFSWVEFVFFCAFLFMYLQNDWKLNVNILSFIEYFYIHGFLRFHYILYMYRIK